MPRRFKPSGTDLFKTEDLIGDRGLWCAIILRRAQDANTQDPVIGKGDSDRLRREKEKRMHVKADGVRFFRVEHPLTGRTECADIVTDYLEDLEPDAVIRALESVGVI